jgi:hypothetical protein
VESRRAPGLPAVPLDLAMAPSITSRAPTTAMKGQAGQPTHVRYTPTRATARERAVTASAGTGMRAPSRSRFTYLRSFSITAPSTRRY